MKKNLLLSTAFALFIYAPVSHAETLKTEIYTQPVVVDNVRTIKFSDFDIDKDGFYTKKEVGKKLFQVFDRDGNEVIDNNEWDMTSVYTITPMEKEVYKFLDKNDDGYTDSSSYTYETFFAESGLAHFDHNKDGLSPKEFIGVNFQSLDDNDDGIIQIEEWEEAYEDRNRPEAAEQERYN